MSILANVKSKWKMSRLKEQVRKDPSPAVVGELAQYYIQNGENDSAYDLVALHMKEYPESEVLKGIWNYLLKHKVGGKIRKALQALEEHPSPKHFQTLIETYRRHCHLGSAMEYCRRFIQQFPSRPEAHRLLGELRMERFSEDFAAKDARAARTAFERALELDPMDMVSRLGLARLYYCAGLTKRAGILVDDILLASPAERKAMDLKEALEGLPEDGEDPDLRFSEIEERRGFYYDWSLGGARMDEDFVHEDCSSALADCLEEFLQVDGITAAAFLDGGPERLETGDAAAVEIPEESFGSFAGRVVEAARKASLRMDMGAFEKGIVEGTRGGMVLRDLRGGAAALHFKERLLIKKTHSDWMRKVEEIAVHCGRNHEKAPEEYE